MASTNKTTNYELSQFLGTDKPAWLADYNQDMAKIDTQMKANADAATAAAGSASTANTSIGTLSSLTTTAKTDVVSSINEVNATANTAQGTANSAATTANACRTDIDKFNLVNRVTLTPSTNLGSINTSTSNVQFASDTTNSVFKVYGRVNIHNLNGISGSLNVKIGDTSLRPTTAYEINAGAIIVIRDTQNNIYGFGARNLKINTDGSIYVVGAGSSSIGDLDGTFSSYDVTIFPCLYFNSDFGDQ